MNQSRRLQVFETFNERKSAAAMVATDVASRGLDFARVDWVIQLDCPATVEDYIHRSVYSVHMFSNRDRFLLFLNWKNCFFFKGRFYFQLTKHLTRKFQSRKNCKNG